MKTLNPGPEFIRQLAAELKASGRKVITAQGGTIAAWTDPDGSTHTAAVRPYCRRPLLPRVYWECYPLLCRRWYDHAVHREAEFTCLPAELLTWLPVFVGAAQSGRRLCPYWWTPAAWKINPWRPPGRGTPEYKSDWPQP